MTTCLLSTASFPPVLNSSQASHTSPATSASHIQTKSPPACLAQQANSLRWQDNFLRLIPRIQTHASIRFRYLPAGEREEAVAEAVAASCVSYHQLAQQGQLYKAFAGTLANFAVRHVRQQRRVGGHVNSKDVMHPLAQQQRGLKIQSVDEPIAGGWRLMAVEDRKAGPAETAMFRLDFQSWHDNLPSSQQQMLDALADGERPGEVARRFGLSGARISQLRRQWQDSWQNYQQLQGTA